MKSLTKISFAVVIGAALAAASAAQSRPNHSAPNTRPAQRSGPSQSAPRTQPTVRVNAPVERSFSFGNRSYAPLSNGNQRAVGQHTINTGGQNRGFNLNDHPVDTGMNGFRNQRSNQNQRGNGQSDRNGWGQGDNQDFGGNRQDNRTNYRQSNDNRQNAIGRNGQDRGGDYHQSNDSRQGETWRRDDQNRRSGYERRENAPRFNFSFYLSAPTGNSVESPWYYYPSMPAYLPFTSVVVENPGYVNWDEGSLYYEGDNYALDNAINEINAVFQSGNTSDAARLTQPYTNVEVYNDGQYQYSLSGMNFAKTMQDDAESTQTVSFQISSVRQDGAYAVVDAAHTFVDPDGNTQTVYQEYRLQNMGGSFYIVDFSTSETPLG